MYIHQKKGWPHFIWDEKKINHQLIDIKFQQGQLLGKMQQLGFDLRSAAVLKILTHDVVKSSEIEGEHLDALKVRSSIAKQLKIKEGGLVKSTRDIDGIVEMIIDATQNFSQPLTQDRLFDWHTGLFPTGLSGMSIINTGVWRLDQDGPMQVVSGAYGRQRIHFEAVPAKKIQKEMDAFLNWFNSNQPYDLVIKAAIAHLWFVTIHPFDDGNGRMARAISDLLLARSEQQGDRFYSMSSQIRVYRKEYYDVLEKTQKGDLNITLWLHWFLKCLSGALNSSEDILEKVLVRSKFWATHAQKQFNERQQHMLHLLLNEFKGKLTTTKWAKITKCSQDTATRDIQDLCLKGVLEKGPKGGRSTSYVLHGLNLKGLDET